MLDPVTAVARHIDACGGRSALENLNTLERRGDIVFYLQEGNCQGSYYTRVAYPDKALIHIDAGNIQIHQGLVQGTAFHFDTSANNWIESGTETSVELAETARVANREILYEESQWRNGSIGADGEYILVCGKPVRGQQTLYRFSRQSGLLVSKSRGDRMRRYGEWRNVQGMRFPFAIDDYKAGKCIQRIRLNQIRHGISLNDDWDGLETLGGQPGQCKNL